MPAEVLYPQPTTILPHQPAAKAHPYVGLEVEYEVRGYPDDATQAGEGVVAAVDHLGVVVLTPDGRHVHAGLHNVRAKDPVEAARRLRGAYDLKQP